MQPGLQHDSRRRSSVFSARVAPCPVDSTMNLPQVLALLVDAIARLPTHRPVRVGIDGRPGAGKTTLGDALADRLEALGRVCLRASLDDFHAPGHEQREKAGGFTPAEYLRE